MKMYSVLCGTAWHDVCAGALVVSCQGGCCEVCVVCMVVGQCAVVNEEECTLGNGLKWSVSTKTTILCCENKTCCQPTMPIQMGFKI